jgi:tetratricopeptide (TPR) repeat protein
VPAERSEDQFPAYQEALRRGHDALLAGNPKGALNEYNRAAALADERALPHMLAGRALLALKRPAEALAAFTRARERAPGNTAAMGGMVDALTILGRRREALALAKEIEQLANQRPIADGTADRRPPGEVLSVAAERAWADGRLETAVEEWLAAARAYTEEGHVDAALDACQRALLGATGDPRVHLELSRLYLHVGWQDLAIERMVLLGRLLDLSPLPEVRRGLAELARTHAARDGRLARLADQMDAPPAG